MAADPEYLYEVINVGQYPDDANARMAARVKDGYRIHTCLPNYSEVAIMWERAGKDEGEEEESQSKGRSRQKAEASA